MICLTGDIHQKSLNNKESKYFSQTSMCSALQYAEMALAYNLKITFFATGLSLLEEPDVAAKLINMPNVELAAHTYDALKSFKKLKYINRICNRRYGPYLLQRRDIKRTLAAFKRFGLVPTGWRTHAYRSDPCTAKLLSEFGFRVMSDTKSLNATGPSYDSESEIVNLPINVIPDHEHLMHGESITSEVRDWKGDVFGHKRLTKDEWKGRVVKQTLDITNSGGVATLLIHPECMDVLDRMVSFKLILEDLSRVESTFVSSFSNCR